MSYRRIAFVFVLGVMFCAWSALACTDIVVGKDASTDGSVITSHTTDEGGPGYAGAFGLVAGFGLGSGDGYDARIRVIQGGDFEPGTMAPVYAQMCEVGPGTELVQVGEIPQVAHTYSYFHVAYPFLNEKQVAIGETTIAQREELLGSSYAIMTIEQLEAFALQRASTAREAIQIMGALAEEYGFQSSCWIMGECVTVTDPNEAWVFEIFGVGPLWKPGSGQLGAIWAARRVPDDEVCVVPNISRIGVIEPGDPDVMHSANYMDLAIKHGWYDPASGEPFNYSAAYTPETGSWSADSIWVRNRLWYVYSQLCPSQTWDPYAPLSAYPFSVKPEKKVSVQDVINFQRTTFEGTPFDPGNLAFWYVLDENGNRVKSPMATPFLNEAEMALYGISEDSLSYRPLARYNCSYGFVSQVRSWLPDPIGGCLWYYNDNPATSIHVPVYCGITATPTSWMTNDRYGYSRDSAWWAFATVDLLANLRYQDAIEDIRAVRDPLQAEFYTVQPAIEQAAAGLYQTDPELAVKLLTNYTQSCMLRAEAAYWDLADELIETYNNNQF